MGINTVKNNLLEAQKVLAQFVNDENQLLKIDQAGELIAKCIKDGNKVISCGNGGSMCDAMHFAEELSGRFRDDRRAMAAVAISDPSHITCVGNDYGFDFIFSRYIEALGNSGDVLLAISTSGNSTNVMNAVKEAKKKGMSVIGLSGKSGGQLAQLADVEIRAPFSKYADRAQEVHIKVIHSLIHLVEEKLA